MTRNVFVLIAALACANSGSAQSPAIPAAEQDAIVKTALDYGDGFYSGAVERMERAIHPDLNKVVVRRLPQTGKFVVQYSTYSGLIELTRAKLGFREPALRKIQAVALAMNADVACAKVTSAMFDDFLTLIKVDDQWKIVNVLWAPGPDTPGRPAMPAVDATKDKDVITQTARDFVQSGIAGDAPTMERVLHPEVSLAVIGTLPSGRQMVNRVRLSGIVEPVRAKLPVFGAGGVAPDIRVLDVMDGMAFVEMSTGNAQLYVQMALLDGQWKIFNVLSKNRPLPK